MESKKCSYCKIEKEGIEFGNSSRSKDGKRSQCKCCEGNYRKIVKNTNLQITHKKCSTCNIKKVVSHFSKNKSQKDNYCNVCKDCVKNNYQSKRSFVLEKNKRYRSTNRSKILKQRKDKYKEIYSTALGRLSINIRNNIRGTLKNKSTYTENILCCTNEEFKKYIESQFLNWMNWDNYGNACETLQPNCSWDLDHIIPISYAKTEEEIYMLNHWSNFQPFCSYKNRIIKKDNIYPLTNLELKITINN